MYALPPALQMKQLSLFAYYCNLYHSDTRPVLRRAFIDGNCAPSNIWLLQISEAPKEKECCLDATCVHAELTFISWMMTLKLMVFLASKSLFNMSHSVTIQMEGQVYYVD